MRLITLLLLTGLPFISGAQTINVNVSGMIFNSSEDSIHISQFYGDHYEDLHGAKFNEVGEFDLICSLPNPDYYVLRFGDSHVNLILRENSNIKVYGDGANISQFTNVIGSDESSKLNEYLRLEAGWKHKLDSANQLVARDPSQRGAVNRDMTNEFKLFQGLQKSFIARNAKSAALLPVLSNIDIKNDFATYESIVNQLNSSFGESPTVKELVKNFEAMKAEQIKNNPLAPGKEAPGFTEAMANGDSLSLSDLRGKVVLLDFWASWCGPCRRENPNVVRLYNKYKDDGFTVMSVSLDKTKAPWIAAIESDGLIWPNHVSDLKGWNSRAPKFYGVRGIPFTVLIDAEGNIIDSGNNTRGEALAKNLARIFGH